MFVMEQRNEWRVDLQNGIIPDHVRNCIETYRSMRNNPNWRSSGLTESLGEAALVLLEMIDKQTQPITHQPMEAISRTK